MVLRVGTARCVTWSTDQIVQLQARITLGRGSCTSVPVVVCPVSHASFSVLSVPSRIRNCVTLNIDW